jgi:hypothetical protein
MQNEDEIKKLTEWFRALGAQDPESWARSQVQDGINQWGRFVFLHQAWQSIVPDGDTTWIDSLIGEADERPNDPGSAAGPALQRMLAAGVNPQDIADVVRVMQWHVLFALAYQLSDAGIVEYPLEKMRPVHWALFEVDENHNPIGRIGGLHESVLTTDPTGREMRPRRANLD